MYSKKLIEDIGQELEALKKAGKFKLERELESPQGAEVEITGKKVLMFASNNYLGLANHPDIIKASREAMDKYGFGLSSVRFIAGTETIHKTLEKRLAEFLGTEDAILYSTNFMSNLGFFASITNEALGSTEPASPSQGGHVDAIYSDELNHASIIDAFKLCKKENVIKRIYSHGDVAMLEQMLEEDKNKGYRFKIIVTDGVFSMEGYLANLPKLRELADKYEALLFVDDAHGAGVLGKTGAGSPEETGAHGRIDVLSGTLGKALGGASGGFTVSSKKNIEFLRQRSRNYIFSNSLAPVIAGVNSFVVDYIGKRKKLRELLWENVRLFRKLMQENGFEVSKQEHPIVPIMIGDATLAKKMASELLKKGIYVIAFSYPVVPEGKARIRVQISAAHTKKDIQRAVEAFVNVGRH